MKDKQFFFFNKSIPKEEDILLDGIYGSFKITSKDRIEVQRYRLSLLFCGISFCAGDIHWFYLRSSSSWIWLFLISLSLGLALNWIHIYIRTLHNTLKALWASGIIGLTFMSFYLGVDNILPTLTDRPYFLLAIGPLFAALSGLGFKEFFCFRRIEAFGLTILLPIALLGHMMHLLNYFTVIILISIASIMLLLMSIRKFGIDAAADIGDKSVFDYLEKQRIAKKA